MMIKIENGIVPQKKEKKEKLTVKEKNQFKFFCRPINLSPLCGFVYFNTSDILLPEPHSAHGDRYGPLQPLSCANNSGSVVE